ncbi:MAG: SGNH/GDSL hydrolase family protein [Phenylobacterium sp.]|uniref:SGNH/GDSL hydrolase family protein n=1 Tax=Phenylobacterium sp. TaxID=1871053 RepID=UPI001A2CC81D|nr:SGNH/GDSL hydrolase family protein [Phenylobacterium sp.]MBJ7410116.1 SGNH/GDSL hydrolase family protein [Phenylobacterium sp.]
MTRANNAKFIAGLQAQRANTADCRVFFIGDSNTVGLRAGASSWANPRGLGYVTQLSDLLTSVTASATGFIGNGNSGNQTQLRTMDGRLAFPTGSGWATTTNATYKIPGGIVISATSGANSEMVFTTPDAVDRCDIYHLTSGTIGWSVDGGSETAITGGTAGVINKSTLDLGSNAIHALKLRNLINAVFVVGLIFYSTMTKRVRLINAGAFNWLTDDWLDTASGGWSPGSNYASFGQELTVIHLTINDSNARADPATSMANLLAMITALRAANSDVWLICPQPISGAATQTVQNNYNAAIKALGAAHGCTVIDLMHDYATYAAWSGASLAADGLHPNFAGHTYVANRIRAAIDAIAAVA